MKCTLNKRKYRYIYKIMKPYRYLKSETAASLVSTQFLISLRCSMSNDSFDLYY
jgi:hypothetical protein